VGPAALAAKLKQLKKNFLSFQAFKIFRHYAMCNMTDWSNINAHCSWEVQTCISIIMAEKGRLEEVADWNKFGFVQWLTVSRSVF
jgi:hypothetical protein